MYSHDVDIFLYELNNYTLEFCHLFKNAGDKLKIRTAKVAFFSDILFF